MSRMRDAFPSALVDATDADVLSSAPMERGFHAVRRTTEWILIRRQGYAPVMTGRFPFDPESPASRKQAFGEMWREYERLNAGEPRTTKADDERAALAPAGRFGR